MELPNVGRNCSFPSCNQLDFLPFQCDGCGKTFCGQHRSMEGHSCPMDCQRPPAEYSGVVSYPCSVDACKKLELAQLVCHHCDLNFCMSHRLQEDHNCVKLPEKRPAVSKTAEHVQKILAQKETKTQPKPTNPKAVQMAAKVALMKLKGKALGDPGIPQDERVYFNVVLPLTSRKPHMPLFVSKVWTVGKVIDVIAARAAITNNNNDITATNKLRLFHGDLGTKLETGKQLADVMSDADSCLVSGVTLILENVPDDIVVLDDLEAYRM